MVSMSDDKSKGCRIGSHAWCTAAANQIGHYYRCAGGLPQENF